MAAAELNTQRGGTQTYSLDYKSLRPQNRIYRIKQILYRRVGHLERVTSSHINPL